MDSKAECKWRPEAVKSINLQREEMNKTKKDRHTKKTALHTNAESQK